MARKTKQVISMFTEEDHDRIVALAEREGLSKSELVRETMRDRLRTEDAMAVRPSFPPIGTFPQGAA